MYLNTYLNVSHGLFLNRAVISLLLCDIGHLLFRKHMLHNVIIARALGEMIIAYTSYMCSGER